MVGGRRLSLRSRAVLVYTAGAPLCRAARRTKKRPALAHICRHTWLSGFSFGSCISKPLDLSCPGLFGDIEESIRQMQLATLMAPAPCNH
jgi:alpha/beta superfamily hydrolase